MPLYEYSCKACSHEFEALVQGGEEAECPECHGRRLERRLSVPGAPKVKSGPRSLPMNSSCPPNLPPCGPGCCRL